MRFFEFNHCDYYAMIGAESKGAAVSYYNEEISDIEKDYSGPDEVTEEYAREKYAAAGAREAGPEHAEDGRRTAIEEFEEMISNESLQIFLIDSELT